MNGTADSKEMESERDKPERDGVRFWISCRFGLCLIGFFGFVHAYAQRVGMSVAIVCMVNHTAIQLQREGLADTSHVWASNVTNVTLWNPLNSTQDDVTLSKCDAPLGEQTSMENGQFVWSKDIQGHILGSFFYGYLVFQVPAGLLAERFGPKLTFSVCFLLSTVCTLLCPLGASLGYGYLIALRVLAGVGSAACYPCFHVIWSRWAPPHERSKLANICYAGSWMGNVVTLPLAGYLCANGFAGGWPSVFYIIGMSSAAWLVIFVLFASDGPSTNWMISKAEKEYVYRHVQLHDSSVAKKNTVPWLKALTSGPIWALNIAAITSDWGLYTFLTNIPTYMYEVLRFDMKSNGLYSAIPYLGMWANMNISPIIADKLIVSGTLSVGNTRKLFQTVGSFGAAMFLVGLAFIDCEHSNIAILLLSCGITISGCVYSGFLVNHMDITPQFAGSLYGLANAMAAATGFLAPYTVAQLTPNQTQKEWQSVFYVSAAIFVFGAIIYGLFASGDIQEWAKEPEPDVEEEMVSLNESKKPAEPAKC